MKIKSLILPTLLLAYYLVLLGIYYGHINAILLTESNAPYFVTMRNPISIFILLGLCYLMLFMASHYLKRKKVAQTICSAFVAIFFFFMSGQVIVNKLSDVQEQFVIFKIKEHHFDAITVGFNYSGYHTKPNELEEYPCYEYCQSIFFRYYQVGPYKQFTVFRGFGPLFSLEENKLSSTN